MNHVMLLRILLLVVLPGGMAWSQINVGNNGGEGVAKDDRLYVRDLYEESTHLNPYIGPAVDDEFRSLGSTGENLRAMGVDLKLLRRKLTDLNQATPGLGFLVLKALSHYRMAFSREPLPPLSVSFSADVDRGRFKDDLRQLAIRRGMEIEFDRRNWNALNPTHRVALVIHEGVFSMLRPIALNLRGDRFAQASPFIRPMVGQLFSQKETIRLNAGRIARQRLGLPPEKFCRENRLEFHMTFFPLAGELARDIFFSRPVPASGSVEPVVADICARAFAARGRDFKLIGQRTLWKLGPVVYGNHDRFQYLILVRPELLALRTSFSASTTASCRASLKTWLPQLMAPRDAEVDAGWFCPHPERLRERTR